MRLVKGRMNQTLAGWLASGSVRRDGAVESRMKEQDTAVSGLDTRTTAALSKPRCPLFPTYVKITLFM
jgi:hypothetical protein